LRGLSSCFYQYIITSAGEAVNEVAAFFLSTPSAHDAAESFFLYGRCITPKVLKSGRLMYLLNVRVLTRTGNCSTKMATFHNHNTPVKPPMKGRSLVAACAKVLLQMSVISSFNSTSGLLVLLNGVKWVFVCQVIGWLLCDGMNARQWISH